MWSITLLCLLITEISGSSANEEIGKIDSNKKTDIQYAGPIVYSDEKPPVVMFPSPPTTVKQNDLPSPRNEQIEYVPFPFQELPILIYKSKTSPPVHIVNDDANNKTDQLNKRFGQVISGQRTGRAINSWTHLNELINKNAAAFAPVDLNRIVNAKAQSFSNNNSDTSSPSTASSVPHVVYSGHPPIHIFPQPIIVKERSTAVDFGEETSASEQNEMYSKEQKNEGNYNEAPSTGYNVPSSQLTSTYAYGQAPAGTRHPQYGFRVRTQGNKHDTDYSGPQYEEDTYGAQSQNSQYSEDPYEAENDNDNQNNEENYGKSSSSGSQTEGKEEYDKETRPRYRETNYRSRYRDKYPAYSSASWPDWDPDNTWLSALFGGNYARWPKYRRFYPFPASSDALTYAHVPTDIDYNNLAMFNTALRPPPVNNWFPFAFRPSASVIRPTYTLSNLLGYRPRPAPIASYFTRYNPGFGYGLAPTAGYTPSASSISPVNVRPYSYNPSSLMGLHSLTFPVKVPMPSYPVYRYRPMSFGYPSGYSNMHSPSGDLAFAESNRKANVSNTEGKYPKSNDMHKNSDMMASASHSSPAFYLPPPVSGQMSPQNAAPNKPPIIIYQGLRPPVHVYQQPTESNNQNENLNNQQSSDSKSSAINEIKEKTSTTTSTENPYSQLFNSEKSREEQAKDNLYYNSQRSASFTPRNSAGDQWTPIRRSSVTSHVLNEAADSNAGRV